jgi:methyl-accepting chemotaxis protein
MKWFLNLKTQTKLLSGFSLVAALLVCVGVMGIFGLGKINTRLDDLYERHFKGVAAIMSVEGDMQRVGKALRQSILETSTDGFDKQATLVVEGEQEMLTRLTETEATLQTDEAKASLKRIRELMTTWVSNHQEVLQFVREDRRDLATAKLGAGAALSKEMQVEIEKMRESKLALGEKATAESTALFNQLRLTMILFVVIGALCGIGLGLYISRLIAVPLGRAAAVLESVAGGDFTQTVNVESKDEIGQLSTSLNAAITSMRTALEEVHAAASSVAAASKQLSAATDEISSGAQEQASSLEETAASLEEMTSAVKQNADNAAHAAQLAHGAREVAEKGGQVVNTAVGAMDEINTSSRKIADIITAIDEIAFQTNLLALNAAVEAARAGEQGRGFAVVAAEVRNLAQRSASSAKEIKTLINDSVAKVEAGSKLVNQSGETLGEIVTSVKRVTDIVGEIAASSREQSTGIEQVNTAVTQMDGVTQANASQTEEMSSTAEALSGQAQQLMDVVRRFKLDSNGSTGAPSSAAVPSRHATPKASHKPLKLVKRARQASRPASAPAPVAVAEAAATGTDGGFEEF